MTSHTGSSSPSDKLGELFVLRKAERGFHRRQVSSESSKGNPWNQLVYNGGLVQISANGPGDSSLRTVHDM